VAEISARSSGHLRPYGPSLLGDFIYDLTHPLGAIILRPKVMMRFLPVVVVAGTLYS
jgi:hypothetical protein